MKIKLFTLAFFLSICACQADQSLDEMKRDMDRQMDRIMDKHNESWDRINQHQEREDQKKVDRINIENQGKKLFGK